MTTTGVDPICEFLRRPRERRDLQREAPATWSPEQHLQRLEPRAQVGSAAPEVVDAEAAEQLYRKLEQAVLPAFHGDAEGWTSLVRHAIALNGSYFTSHRMMAQYATHAYLAEG